MFRKCKGFTEIAVCLALLQSGCGETSATKEILSLKGSKKIREQANRANNLAEAIYDVGSIKPGSDLIAVQIQYFDLDKIDSDHILKSVIFTIHPNDLGLDSDTPEFEGHLNCSSITCGSGSLRIHYYGGRGSKLNGDVRIDFTRRELLTFSKKLSIEVTSTPTENAIAEVLENHSLQTGMIEQFKIAGGLISPFTLHLNLLPDYELNWHGILAGNNSALTLTYSSKAKTTSLEVIGKVSFPDRDSVEICLDETHALRGIGAYGSFQNPLSPLHLCE